MIKAKVKNSFERLGGILAQARVASGFAKQSDFAAALGLTQQAISRWEAGASRPSRDQMGGVAAALQLDPAYLNAVAGYADAPETPAYTQLLPVDRLDATTFERFVEYLLRLKHGEGVEVQAAGKTGHTQDGLDITVVLPSGERETYQCKRVERFGPSEVFKAVKAHTALADRKVLVLSRIASPQAAEAVRESPGWTLWDKTTLTRIVRLDLTPDAQDRLVDLFFPGQRKALLGRDEPNVWVTADEFFAPFAGAGRFFDHNQALVGRQDAVLAIHSALESKGCLSLLVGAAGIGKSRVLLGAVKSYAAANPEVTVRFLLNSKDVDQKSIERLGAGPKVLVIDDAHDRDGLAGLFAYAATPKNGVRLLLATRPYAEDRIRREAANLGHDDIVAIRLERLDRSAALALARATLLGASGDPELAEPIVDMVGASPLVTVLAAKAAAEDNRPLELLKSKQGFKDVVLGRFARVVNGGFGEAADAPAIRGLLEILALVQPFHVEDRGLLDLLQAVKGLGSHDVSRLLRILVEGGVLYRRGHYHRLMPDLLGDYIIEDSCLGPSGRLSPLVKQVFDAAPQTLLTNLIVNLGRLDWRVSDGDPAKQGLLADLWRELSRIEGPYDAKLEAIRAVAIFQPRQALDFVHDQIDRGHVWSPLIHTARAAAYHSDYHSEVCELLWRVGRNDTRTLPQHPDHPIRVLAELGGYDEFKPLAFAEKTFHFALKLFDDPSAWGGVYTPLDLLEQFLSAEAARHTSDARQFTIQAYVVPHAQVAHLRTAIIDKVLERVRGGDLASAYKAATFLQKALRGPTGMMGLHAPKSAIDAYDAEFAATLRRVADILREGVHPLVAIALVRSTSWFAKHGQPRLKAAAQAVQDAEPTDSAFQTFAALTDGYGHVFIDRSDPREWQSAVSEWIRGVVAQLRTEHPDPAALALRIEAAVIEIEAAGAGDNSAHVLVDALLREDLQFARTLIAAVETRPASVLRRFVASALHQLNRTEPLEGMAVALRLLTGADDGLAGAAAASLGGLQGRGPQELDLARRALSSADPGVASRAIWLLRSWEDLDEASRIDLAKVVRFGGDAHLADNLMSVFYLQSDRLADAFIGEDAEHFLARLADMPELRGHWIETFLSDLSCRFPHALFDFFVARVEVAATSKSFDMRPANHGPYSHVPLRFLDGPEAGSILQRAWAWLRANAEREFHFRHHASDLMEAMFLPSRKPGAATTGAAPEILIGFLDSILATTTAAELRWMTRILREAHYLTIFDHVGFMARLLERARSLGPEVWEEAVSDLAVSVHTGVKSSSPGQPAARDLAVLEKADAVLRQLSRGSPAYRLYDLAAKEASREIDRAHRENEAMDDE